MLPLTYKEAARAAGSETSLEGKFTSVTTDTRKAVKDCLFIALAGEKFDGHDFAAAALEKGAGAVMVERDLGLGKRQIIVGSTGQALLDLAGYYRSLFKIPVVGVTGSVGKTTTKEMIAAVLGSKYKTLKTEGNHNNEIGMPLTLFELEIDHEAAVIEMGMNHFGEISRMTAAAKPDIAVISNIGVSHIENLGSREGILKAKLEILEGMKGDAPIVLNGDDDMLSKADTGSHPRVFYSVSNSSCAYTAFDITSTDDETEFTVGFSGGPVRACLPFTGRHNIYNALAACAVGELCGISVEQALEALKNYKTTGLRQKIVKKNSITFIEDCYNASPDSQAAALAVLGSMNSGRKIAVLGDMLELGSYSETAHRLVGKYAAQNGADIVFTYGEQSLLTAESAKENGVKDVRTFSDKNELAASLAGELKEGDAVLFKASRYMKLEEVIYKVFEILDLEK